MQDGFEERLPGAPARVQTNLAVQQSTEQSRQLNGAVAEVVLQRRNIVHGTTVYIYIPEGRYMYI